jgi:hypothetical protein
MLRTPARAASAQPARAACPARSRPRPAGARDPRLERRRASRARASRSESRRARRCHRSQEALGERRRRRCPDRVRAGRRRRPSPRWPGRGRGGALHPAPRDARRLPPRPAPLWVRAGRARGRPNRPVPPAPAPRGAQPRGAEGDDVREPSLLELGIDHGGFRVEVEQLAQAGEKRHERRHQRERHLNVEMGTTRLPRRRRACRGVSHENHAATAVDPGGAAIPIAFHQLHPGQRVALQAAKQDAPGIRSAVGQRQAKDVPDLDGGGGRGCPG